MSFQEVKLKKLECPSINQSRCIRAVSDHTKQRLFITASNRALAIVPSTRQDMCKNVVKLMGVSNPHNRVPVLKILNWRRRGKKFM